jgi:hypothetical protein
LVDDEDAAISVWEANGEERSDDVLSPPPPTLQSVKIHDVFMVLAILASEMDNTYNLSNVSIANILCYHSSTTPCVDCVRLSIIREESKSGCIGNMTRHEVLQFGTNDNNSSP